MITTYYRCYRLHIFAHRVEIWAGTEHIDTTTDEADAQLIIDAWHEAA